MLMSVNDKIAFSANSRIPKEQDRKDAEKKVVTGGGALAATTAAARTKAAKSGFDMFSSASKVSKGMTGITEASRTATSVANKTKGLWAKVGENAKWAKDAILGWASKFKNMKYIKPIVNSAIFKKCAGALGYGFGFVTLVSGLADITKVTTETINNKMS